MNNELRIGNNIILKGIDYNHEFKYHDPSGDEVIDVTTEVMIDVKNTTQLLKLQKTLSICLVSVIQ
jgi:hypothetical protein